MYALLRAFDRNESAKRRGWWLVVAAALFSIISQLHFLALIVFGLTGLAFLLYYRPRINWRYWLGSVLVVLFFYFPVIVNDWKTGGDNLGQFVAAFEKKSDNKAGHNLPEKVVKDVTENALYHGIILSGSQTADLPKLVVQKDFDIQCDYYCRNHLAEGLLFLLFFLLGAMLLIKQVAGKFRVCPLRQKIRTTLAQIKKETPKEQFLMLNFILFSVSLAIFLPLAFDFSARFFLIILPLPFLFLGLIWNLFSARWRWIGWLLVLGLVGSNLLFAQWFFVQLKEAKSVDYQIPRDRILKQKTRITLEQEKAVMAELEKQYQENAHPIIYRAQPEFHRALAYLLDQKNIPRDGISTREICQKANYFLVIRSQSNLKRALGKYESKFEVKDKKQLGTLTIIFLQPKKEAVNCENFDLSKFHNQKKASRSVAKRYTWGEVFK